MTRPSDTGVPREKIEAALSYLRREFPAGVSSHETPSCSLHVRAEEGECAYEVEFSEEFFEDHSAEDIGRLLNEWTVADEMRRVEGMAVSVSSAGVRLDSSN